ncbi:MAG TPA: ABC transporter substrate-binding protein [Baekduia sp.]|nr:ABC transporter substrate-binding protein [Baekduia sp.]
MSSKATSPQTARRALIAGLAVVALAAAGCGGKGTSTTSTQSPSAKGSTLRIGLSNALGAGLNPATDLYKPLYTIPYENLITVTGKGDVVPGLAKSWRYEKGSKNTIFKITLGDGLKFSNGEPVTPAAVKGYIEYWQRVNPYAPNVPIKQIDTAANTVTLTFKGPHADAVYDISHYNLGAIAAPEAVKNPKLMQSDTYGAGQYVLDKQGTVPGDTYAFVPNKAYHDQNAIKWNKITAKLLKDAGSSLQAVQAGQLDVVEGDPTTAGAAKKAGLTVAGFPNGTATLLFQDQTGDVLKPLGDPRVRQAINYAIDRAALAGALGATPSDATSEVKTTNGWDPALRNYYKYDVNKAKSLLADAGYADGFKMTCANLGALRPALGDPLVQAVAKYLGAVGIKVEALHPTSVQEGIAQARKAPCWIAATPESPVGPWYQLTVAPTAFTNITHFVEPKLQAMIDRADAADVETAAPIWKQVMPYVTEHAMVAPLFIEGVPWFSNAKTVRNVTGSGETWGGVTPVEIEPADGSA